MEAISLKYWALVWSTYSLIDPRCVEYSGSGLVTSIPKQWKILWIVSTSSYDLPYAYAGPHSYSDQTTWGFFVDVGNGFTTLIPTVLFATCMTWPLLPARVVGVMGILKFYQEMYGTIIYFFSFCLNKRYEDKPAAQVYLIIVSNSIWIVGPMAGLYASYLLLDKNDFSVFRSS